VARYIGRHGTGRLSKTVLISSGPPHMLNTDSNPGGALLALFDGLRARVVADRSGFFKELAMPSFGYNRPGAKVSQGAIDAFWRQGMAGDLKGEYECIEALSETDFNHDSRKMNIPTLALQGDDDQIVPIAVASLKPARTIPNAKLVVYPRAPHGLPITLADRVNQELLAFIKS
jgi:non-heme chloroperoxidase